MSTPFYAVLFAFSVSICNAQSSRTSTLGEAEYYVAAYAQHYELPVGFVRAVIAQESGWRACAISSKGAVGLMQLMPQPEQNASVEDTKALICQIEAMAGPLGRRLYRGILKTVARAWNPSEIREADVLGRVWAQMQSAERGLRRLEDALDRSGPEILVPILRSLRLNSIDQLDSLDNLRRVVLEVERVAECTH